MTVQSNKTIHVDSFDDARLGIARETTHRTNPEFTMKKPADQSVWTAFEDTWTPEEIRDELVDWKRERVAELIQTTAQTIADMFHHPADGSAKALMSLCFRLIHSGRDILEYSASSRGSKFGVEREHFSGSIRIIDTPNHRPFESGSSTTHSAELVDVPDSTPDDAPKIQPVWLDASTCLALWDQLRASSNDAKGSTSAQEAALLLVHLDFISAKSAADYNGLLEGLNQIKASGVIVESGKDAMIETHRLEDTIDAMPGPRSKM